MKILSVLVPAIKVTVQVIKQMEHQVKNVRMPQGNGRAPEAWYKSHRNWRVAEVRGKAAAAWEIQACSSSHQAQKIYENGICSPRASGDF